MDKDVCVKECCCEIAPRITIESREKEIFKNLIEAKKVLTDIDNKITGYDAKCDDTKEPTNLLTYSVTNNILAAQIIEMAVDIKENLLDS